MLGITNTHEETTTRMKHYQQFIPSLLITILKKKHWHLPFNTVSFVSKKKGGSNIPLWPRRWDRRSQKDGRVVACSHQKYGHWPHRHNTIYVVAVRPPGCCSQDI